MRASGGEVQTEVAGAPAKLMAEGGAEAGL